MTRGWGKKGCSNGWGRRDLKSVFIRDSSSEWNCRSTLSDHRCDRDDRGAHGRQVLGIRHERARETCFVARKMRECPDPHRINPSVRIGAKLDESYSAISSRMYVGQLRCLEIEIHLSAQDRMDVRQAETDFNSP
jgi:hypothetical protein